MEHPLQREQVPAKATPEEDVPAWQRRGGYVVEDSKGKHIRFGRRN